MRRTCRVILSIYNHEALHSTATYDTKPSTAEQHALLARISSDNTVSIRLHESLGFSVVGVLMEVGFKFGRLLGVAIMELLF